MLGILVTLIIIGILLYLVNTFIPMDGKIKTIINVVVIVIVILWLLQVFGVLRLVDVPVPRVHHQHFQQSLNSLVFPAASC